MKIVQRSNHVYYAHVQTPEGRRRISLGVRDADEARTRAALAGLAELERTGRVSSLTIRPRPGSTPTVADAAELFFEWARNVRQSPSTRLKSRTVVLAFLKHARLAALHPAAITTAHVGDFINRAGPVSFSSRQRELSALHSMFKVWLAKGLIKTDPSFDVGIDHRALSHDQLERHVRRPISESEYQHIIAHTTGWWRWATAIAWATGMRLGDVVCLEWAAFSEPDSIIVWTKKRGHRVCLPINETLTPGLAAILREIPANASPYLFPEEQQKWQTVSARPGYSIHYGRILKRLDITGASFHCLRHARITAWAAAGFSLEACAAYAGHGSTRPTRGYVHRSNTPVNEEM